MRVVVLALNTSHDLIKNLRGIIFMFIRSFYWYLFAKTVEKAGIPFLKLHGMGIIFFLNEGLVKAVMLL